MNILQVDAFTDRPFAGNPAAVCVMAGAAEEAWMQNVAAEMNLSETAFLHPKDDAYHLRWFTPVAEVDLCGHATLASSHVLWEEGHLPKDQIAKFDTKSGRLTAVRKDGLIELDFPADPPKQVEAPRALLDALGASPVAVLKGRFDYLLELESEEQVRSLKPDFGRMKDVSARGVMVTSRGKDHDFVSRFFAPAFGIDEDPVTGSAHCCLGMYWTEKLGKTEMTAFQASARGGIVRVRVDGDRIKLGGQAVTVLKGELRS